MSRFEKVVRHGMGFENGTNALVIAMQALEVEPKDDAITVSNTATPIVVSIREIGARPRSIDIDRHAYLMDTIPLENAITPHTCFRSPK